MDRLRSEKSQLHLEVEQLRRENGEMVEALNGEGGIVRRMKTIIDIVCIRKCFGNCN